MKKIGIIYSPGRGTGWSTWGDPASALDQELALAVDSNDSTEIRKVAAKNWPGEYAGGLDDAIVAWVDEGTMFRIEEYDGNESLIFPHELNWQVAK